MQPKVLLAALASSLISMTNAAALSNRATLDIFDPRIISPNATTTWVVGSVETVTWDTSNAPASISNRASVILKPANSLTPQYNLTSGFNLRSGSVNVTVPSIVVPGQWQIVLYGDSGNVSPAFAIVAA